MESYKNHTNGGLWLFDCDKYVRKADVETIFRTAQQGDTTWTDERVLFELAKEDVKLLDAAWNVLLPLHTGQDERYAIASKVYDKVYNGSGIYERARKDPYLLHWAGRPKPWVCPDVPYGGEWWQTALRTPFVGHIIARMVDELEKRRQYYRERYGKEVGDIWELSPKEIDRTQK